MKKPEKKHRHESSLKTKDEASIRILKFIAPEVMAVCGKSSSWTKSPCECTDSITCAYCVQASLLKSEKKIKANDNITSKIISSIIRKGIRKTARDLGIDHSTVKYWIKSKNIPQWVIKKYAEVGE